MKQPEKRPRRPLFSSGPCAKRPGWELGVLQDAFLGRSHRAREGKAKLQSVIEQTHALLELPDDYVVGIVPASDTGAFEMSMWSLLGGRGVDVLAWESFGKGWVTDITRQLRIKDVRVFDAAYGELPDLGAVDFSRDVVFTWNGTTSGVRVPNGDWIPDTRDGLTLVDATSAVFAQRIAWEKADVVTFSWQKVLGGEAAHGMLILSPRAVSRLETWTPPWPMPKIFRLTKNGKLDASIFKGATINTPSMLCVEDCLDALSWVRSVGGRDGMISLCDQNANVVFDWISRSEWVENLAVDADTWSNTSVCLKICAREVLALDSDDQARFAKRVAQLLEEEGIAFDIGSYRDAPPGLRIWTGATVETSDLEALMPWLDWAYEKARTELVGARS